MADPPVKRSRIVTAFLYGYVIIPVLILIVFLLFMLAWYGAFD
jgi:hypothetical protein